MIALNFCTIFWRAAIIPFISGKHSWVKLRWSIQIGSKRALKCVFEYFCSNCTSASLCQRYLILNYLYDILHIMWNRGLEIMTMIIYKEYHVWNEFVDHVCLFNTGHTVENKNFWNKVMPYWILVRLTIMPGIRIIPSTRLL